MLKKRDVLIGLGLITTGIASGLAVAIFFVLRQETIPVSMLLASAGLVFLGIIMLFFDSLESALMLKDEIDCLPELVEDDIENLRQSRITSTHAMILITALTLMGHVLSLFLFRKWRAYWWGGVSVVTVAVIVGFVVALWGISMDWFQYRKARLSWWVFLIPFLFYGLSAFLGVHFTEPRIEGTRSLPISQGGGYEYAWAATRTGQDAFMNGVSFLGDGVDIDCDDEGCLVLILLVIGIACVIASASIPHFWVVATTILWVIMFLFSLRELFCTDGSQAQQA
jgi:NO-binding membrane sensor protein with MHYT domain